jgi:hypothetical protein
MGVEGIWKVDMHAADGWQCVGTGFFEDGWYLRGGDDAYVVGTDELDGDQIVITATSTRFRGRGAVFGKATGESRLRITGVVEDDTITAEATDGTYTTHFLATRLGYLP